MSVRLVKGAYWDSEIKRAQERGLASFPGVHVQGRDRRQLPGVRAAAVRGSRCDLSAVRHPQRLHGGGGARAGARRRAPYEFQRLHGMGEALYAAVRAEVPDLPPVRVYAPVGTHEDLLALSRAAPARERRQHLLRPPVPESADSRGAGRARSRSPSLDAAVAARRAADPRAAGAVTAPSAPIRTARTSAIRRQLAALEAEVRASAPERTAGGPITRRQRPCATRRPGHIARRHREIVGCHPRCHAHAEIRSAMDAARRRRSPPGMRRRRSSARGLPRARPPSCSKQRRGQFLSLLVREAGKTLPDAVAELREAVDFCRYYAARGRELFGAPRQLPGPDRRAQTALAARPRRVRLHQPVELPAGDLHRPDHRGAGRRQRGRRQARPATPLIAHAMTRLLHEAGVPPAVLQLTPADGPPFGEVALTHPALAGVAFTGSTATAATINRALASARGRSCRSSPRPAA